MLDQVLSHSSFQEEESTTSVPQKVCDNHRTQTQEEPPKNSVLPKTELHFSLGRCSSELSIAVKSHQPEPDWGKGPLFKLCDLITLHH